MDLDCPRAIPPEYPPHVPISTECARELDRRASAEFRIPSLVLMEHAAAGVAALVARLAGPGGSVAVLCGPGNNGGDGYGIARFLRSWGWRVTILRCAPAGPAPETDAGLEQALAGTEPGSTSEPACLDAWSAPGAVQEALARRPAVAVDALFGVGLTRALGEPFLGWVRAVNASACLRVAVDVPSGLDSDTGEERPICVRADVTATMVAPKHGLLARPELCGRIVEIDIGLPRALHAPHLRSRP